MNKLKEISPSLIFIGAIVLISTIIWSTAFSKKEIKTYKNAVSVVGVATKDVTSDKAVWRISILRQSLDRSKNLIELASDEKKVRGYLADIGFEKNSISSSKITVDTQFKPRASGYGNTTEVEAYETKLYFTITTPNVIKVNTSVNDLRKYGEENNINLVEDYAEYTYSAFESEKIPLLQKAIEDAQERANALVNATKGVSKTTVGKVLSAQQGVFQLNSKDDNSVSDYGNFDTSSIDKTIRATVKVDFDIE